jgi:hypothetical protein
MQPIAAVERFLERLLEPATARLFRSPPAVRAFGGRAAHRAADLAGLWLQTLNP